MSSSTAAMPGRQQEENLSLLVVIPCLNEEATVEGVIAGIPAELPGIAHREVLVVDDGSTDRTGALAKAAGAIVLRHEKNLGLGSSFREAVEVALTRGVDILVNIDGDGQFDPSHIPILLEPIVDQRAEMVTASRFLDAELLPRMPAIKRWGNRWVAKIVSLLTGRRYQDVSCGFRAFSRKALLQMNLFGTFTYTQESFLDLAFKGLRILEVPVRVRGTREFGQSRIASNLPRYAYRALRIMLRSFISYRPLRFFASLAVIFAAIGLSLLGFLGMHYFRTGAFSPHLWSGFIGGSFSFLAILTLIIGLLGDMLVRIRMNQEMILYLLRSRRDGDRTGH